MSQPDLMSYEGTVYGERGHTCRMTGNFSHEERFSMSYVDIIGQSIKNYSSETVSLIDVPERLRIRQSSLVALSYDMHDRIARNDRARSSSVRNAAKRSTS